MFPKKNKLTRKDFTGNSFDGRSLHTPLFTLIHKHTSQNRLKIGVIASKKISKKAVVRNLLKRKLYHFLQNMISKSSPHKILIITKPQINTASTHEIVGLLKNSLNKLKQSK